MIVAFDKIVTSEKCIQYLSKRRLLSQFDKQVNFMLDRQFQSVRFKIRKPKELGDYYFRINKQYRAVCKLE